MTHDELMASGLHECASDCPPRRYREDGQRVVKVRGVYVRRPQAAPQRGLSAQEWRELGYALIVWLLVLVALFYALPIWAAAAS